MAEWMYDNGEIGAGIYGLVNRLLIPPGLHHVINTSCGSRPPSAPRPTGTGR